MGIASISDRKHLPLHIVNKGNHLCRQEYRCTDFTAIDFPSLASSVGGYSAAGSIIQGPGGEMIHPDGHPPLWTEIHLSTGSTVKRAC